LQVGRLQVGRLQVVVALHIRNLLLF